MTERDVAEEYYDKEYFEKGIDAYTSEKVHPCLSTVGKILVDILQPKRVLEIGCAKGFLVQSLHMLSVDAYGIDISSYAVSHCPSDIKDRVQRLDIENEILPFNNEFFDLVVLFEVIEHFHDFDNALTEIKRVLRPGGFVFISTPDGKCSKTVMQSLLSDPTHINIHEKKFWVNLFKSYGFIHEKIKFDERRLDIVFMRHTPLGRFGSFLCRLGVAGKSMRLFVLLLKNKFKRRQHIRIFFRKSAE